MAEIRKATLNDVDAMVICGRQFYRFGGFADKGLPMSEQDLIGFIAHTIESDFAVSLVAEDNGQIIGGITGLIFPWFLDFKHMMLQETWFWMLPAYHGSGTGSKMLQAFEDAGKAAGVKHVLMITLDAPHEDRLEQYYKKMGYTHLEHQFIKEI